jgi:hypothetical protein
VADAGGYTCNACDAQNCSTCLEDSVCACDTETCSQCYGSSNTL